jgi:hypothetical protein
MEGLGFMGTWLGSVTVTGSILGGWASLVVGTGLFKS